MTTVAIVEDNAGLRNGLKRLLDETPGYRCIGVYPSGEDALRQIPKTAPQVVLMDIHLPNISGIECTAKLKELIPGILIVMITAYGDHDKTFKALRAGASGYLLKRSSPEEIIQAIHDVMHGGSPMTSGIARKVVEAFQQPAATGSEDHNLSRREKEVLDLLARGCSDKDIANQLSVCVPTVRFHLKHIYEKLHVRSRLEAVLMLKRGKEGNS